MKIRSRSLRRLLSNRLGLVALGVVSAYLVIAAAIFLGAISIEATRERVGPSQLPGFFGSQSAERRLSDCAFRIGLVDRALGRSDAEGAVRAIRLAELRVADVPIDELRERVARAWQAHDRIDA